jgi:hypothetical protein
LKNEKGFESLLPDQTQWQVTLCLRWWWWR